MSELAGNDVSRPALCGLCGLPADTCGGFDDHVRLLAEFPLVDTIIALYDTAECDYEGYHDYCATHDIERAGFVAVGPDDDLKLCCPHDAACRLGRAIIAARSDSAPIDAADADEPRPLRPESPQ